MWPSPKVILWSSSTSWAEDDMSEADTMIEVARELDGPLEIGGVSFTSRLIVGTGK